MKKLTILGLIMVLLAFSAIPVMAAGPNHGHGNGASAGHGNGGGNGNQTMQQDNNQSRNNGRGKSNAPGLVGKNNQTSMRTRTPFYLQGTITSVVSDTLTISVTHGNAQVKQAIGSDLTVIITDTTMIFEITQGDEPDVTAPTTPDISSTDEETPGNRVPIEIGDLAKGDRVAIHGNVDGGTFNATLITVYKLSNTNPHEADQP